MRISMMSPIPFWPSFEPWKKLTPVQVRIRSPRIQLGGGSAPSGARQGRLLLGYANKITKLVSEAERELGTSDGKVSGELPLGVSTTIAQYVLPRLLGAFLDECPRVQFSLHSGNTSQIVQL